MWKNLPKKIFGGQNLPPKCKNPRILGKIEQPLCKRIPKVKVETPFIPQISCPFVRTLITRNTICGKEKLIPNCVKKCGKEIKQKGG